MSRKMKRRRRKKRKRFTNNAWKTYFDDNKDAKQLIE